MANKISLLDATLRDGGQGLEDLYKNGFTDRYYTEDMKSQIIDSLNNSDIEIIELGAITPTASDLSKFAIYQNIEDLSMYLPIIKNPRAMYVGLYIGPDTNVDLIPECNKSLVDGVRVILRYSELKKSIDYCATLAKKGYKVFVQPMLTMRYTNEELNYIISASNDMGAYACYFVDSYGFMQPKDILRLFNYYDNRLNKDIKIGWHAHNNMNLAYANTLYFLNLETERSLIVDSCAICMGQGAGNLQTELIVSWLNKNKGKHYDFDSILNVCDIVDKGFDTENLWGYSTTRLLPALYNTAYKYSFMMRKYKGMTYSEINKALQLMSEELRHRYTFENLESIIKLL